MKSVIYLLIIVFLSECQNANTNNIDLDKPLPDFSILLTDSSTYFKSINLSKNKPAVLFYFSPNCPYCRTQLNKIVEGMKQLQHIEFLIVTTASFQEMKLFYNKYQLYKYSNIITGLDYTNFFINYFKVTGIPYLAIYDRNKLLKASFSRQTPISTIRKKAEQ